MLGTVLVFEDIAINRIALNVKLSAAGYNVVLANTESECRALAETEQANLVLLASQQPFAAQAALTHDLKELTHAPIVALQADSTPAARFGLLDAGADEVLQSPPSIPALLARFRALRRSHERQEDIRFQRQMSTALGFREEQADFLSLPEVLLLGRDSNQCEARAATLKGKAVCRIASLTAAGFLRKLEERTRTADVLILDLAADDIPEKLDLLSELRANMHTRNSGILVVLPQTNPAIYAEAFDRGADEVITRDAPSRELHLRLRQLATQKARRDRHSAHVKAGISAAMKDPLTDLFNRRYALPHLAQILESPAACAVLAVDVDHFKSINDRFGHAVGDHVLKELARLLKEHLGSDDIAARMGGEEFLLIMPQTGLPAAKALAQRLCTAVAMQRFEAKMPGGGFQITISIGVASRQLHDDTPEALLERADRALYMAKTDGRNRVTVGHPSAA